jgi:hypothetical protein
VEGGFDDRVCLLTKMRKQATYLLTLFLLMLSTTGALLAACTATEKNADYGDLGVTSATVSVRVNAVGDLVVFTAWCYPGCTSGSGSVTLSGQAATKTTVDGVNLGSSPDLTYPGQNFIYYILSSNSSGTLTATFTASGAGLQQTQISYIDFTPSTSCSFAHDADSAVGTGTNSTNINTPSITPSASGELLFNFTSTGQHVTAVNSPWVCPIYSGQGETQTCFFNVTQNAAAYILSSAAGSTANKMTDNTSGIFWEGLITSFSISSGPNPPTNVSVTVN